MSKKSSYQKLKDEILSLKRELIIVSTTDGEPALQIKVKYKMMKGLEGSFWQSDVNYKHPNNFEGILKQIENTNFYKGIINSMQNIQA